MTRIINPVRFNGDHGEVDWGVDGLHARPELAVQIPIMLSLSSTVELSIARVFGHCLEGAPEGIATGIYVLLEDRSNWNMQRDVLIEIARSRLTPQLHGRLTHFLNTEYPPLRNERNKLAHALWFACRSNPDILLRSAPRTEMEQQGARFGIPFGGGMSSNHQHDQWARRMEVYDLNLFMQLRKAFDLAVLKAEQLKFRAAGVDPWADGLDQQIAEREARP